MSAFIGPLGGLVQIECPSDLRPTMERPFAEKSTTSGIVRQQVSQRTRRQWDFAVGVATPAQAAQLAAIVAGEFGIGPFWFVDPWAQVTNLLAPGPSTFEEIPAAGASRGGPVDLPDGARAGRSMVIENPATITVLPVLNPTTFHRAPVIPGRPVTGSVYATGGGVVQIRLQWYNAAGAQLPSTSFASFTPGSAMARIRRTGTPPAGAVSVLIAVTGASRLARPAVTWTNTLMDWHVGQGAPSVAIPATLGQDIILATRENRGGRYAAVSTTIREVG